MLLGFDFNGVYARLAMYVGRGMRIYHVYRSFFYLFLIVQSPLSSLVIFAWKAVKITMNERKKCEANLNSIIYAVIHIPVKYCRHLKKIQLCSVTVLDKLDKLDNGTGQ